MARRSVQFCVLATLMAATSWLHGIQADEPVPGDTLTTQSTLPRNQVPIEEIVVRGERSPRLWRMHIERAEDDLYKLFNSLVDSREYRVTCSREPPTGSYIPIRSCEPGFVARERARHARNVVADWRSGDEDEPMRVMRDAINNNAVSETDLHADLADKYESMNEHMLELALENPELLAALQRLGELQAAFRQHAPR